MSSTGPSATAPPQPGSPPDLGAIPLPPPPQPASHSATAARDQQRWDRVLAFLVLVLAFLSASFLARNSDLWFHLATGRLLAQGQFLFGVDPFAYTTERVYWACHSWLFDLGLYALFGAIGGVGLVVLKALLVTAVAGILLRVRRPQSTALVPVVCTTLAILAM